MSKPKEDKNINIPESVLKDLLTPSEVRMLKNRWRIFNLLNEGMTIREIAEQVQVGTDTVIRVSRLAEKTNLQSKTFQKGENKTHTPWIFGKSDD